jgi:hypothetical protein
MPSKVTALRNWTAMMRSVSMSLPVTGMPRPEIWRRLNPQPTKSVIAGITVLGASSISQ